ncbi:hypothetical protein GQ457_01G054450 [Hibiscus cannabinus]
MCFPITAPHTRMSSVLIRNILHFQFNRTEFPLQLLLDPHSSTSQTARAVFVTFLRTESNTRALVNFRI